MRIDFPLLRRAALSLSLGLSLATAACDGGSETTDDGTETMDSESESDSNTTMGTTTDTDSSTGIGPVEYGADIQPIWNMSCGCHIPGEMGMTADYLELTEGVSEMNLVNAASEDPGDVMIPRVTPGSTDDSYLWHKLQDTHLDVGGTGDKMPPFLPLGDDDMAKIESWINGL